MTNKELLEVAAKAAGIETTGYEPRLGLQYVNGSEDSPYTDYWNPLENDSDAFRLMVKCGMGVSVPSDYGRSDVISFENSYAQAVVEHGNDPYAATRRAIVMVAAQIGKGMK
jgi:hypothetical protein